MKKSEENVPAPETKFEDLLALVGSAGRWQLQVCLVGVIMGTIVISQAHNYVFLMMVPDHWCRLPALDDGAGANWTLERLKDVALPKETRNNKFTHSQCRIFQMDLESLIQEPWDPQLAEKLLSNNSTESVACTQWDYNRTPYEETTVSEWDLVCDRAALRSTLISIMIFGNLIGSLAGGIISDKFGRRIACIVTGAAFAVGSVSSSFAPSYVYMLVLRAINGAGGVGLFTCTFTLMIELVSTKNRAKWNNYFDTGPACAFFLSATLGYFFTSWRTIQLSGSLPSIPLLIIIWWLIPESPRWLLTKGRLEEAQSLLENVAAKNRKEVKPELLRQVIESVRKEVLKESSTSTDDRGYWKKMAGRLKKTLAKICGREFRTRSMKMAFCWFVTAFLIYAVIYMNARLDAGPVIAIALQGVMVLLSRLTIWWPLDHWGRKNTFCTAFFLAGGLMIGVAFVPEQMSWLILCLFLVVTYNGSTLFSVVYLITAELFPTEVRNLTIGAGSVCARLGGIASPYVVDLLGRYSYFVPNLVLGIAGLLAGVVSLTLPETRKETLPDTVHDVEEQQAQQRRKSSSRTPSVWTTTESASGQLGNGVAAGKQITRL